MATLRDVAKKAGVSTATVSCALSGAKPVKPETYMRVMDAVEQLKYIPNISARNLKRTENRMVGVILPDMKSRFYAEMVDGISLYLQGKGYTINIAFSNGSSDVECEKIDEFITQNCAGLLIVTSQPGNAVFFQGHILDYHVPVVFLDREPKTISANYIGFRNYDAMYRLAEELLKEGYREISVLCGPLDFSPESDSVQGLSDAMEAFRPGLAPRRICVTNLTREDAFSSFLKDFSKEVPEILISTSREATDGIQAALEYCGLSTPDDMLLLSYSEESWININQTSGVYLLPRASANLGEQAARMLLKNIQDPGTFEKSIVELETPGTEILTKIPACPDRNRHRKTRISVPEKSVIRFLAIDNPTVRALELLTDHFTRTTGIRVEITRIKQDELFQMVSRSVEQLTARYDLYTYDVPWLEYMVQNLCLADITAFAMSDDFPRGQMFAENLRNCQIENRFFGIPLSGGTQLLFYRPDLFENRILRREYQKQSRLSLRAPRTWKEFNDIAAFFTRSENPSSPTEYGVSLAGIIDEELAPEILIRLWSFGGKLWDDYHRPTFATKENQMAFESLLSTIRYIPEQSLGRSIRETVEDFCSGRTAMLITYSEFAQEISKHIKENDTGRVFAHFLPGKHPASVGWNVGLNPFSSMHEEVYRFMSWLCQVDTGFYLTILNGASPVTAPYRNHELQKLYPWLSVTEESLANATRRNSPYRKKKLILPPNEIEHIICKALRRIVSDGLTIQEALDEAQGAGEHLFSMYGYPIAHDIFRKTR